MPHTFEYGFLEAPFALSVNPVAQMIVTINCSWPGSKPNLICIRPPTFGSINTGPPGVNRFAYRTLVLDAWPPARPELCRSGEPGDVTKTLGLSRRSYVSGGKSKNHITGMSLRRARGDAAESKQETERLRVVEESTGIVCDWCLCVCCVFEREVVFCVICFSVSLSEID